MEITLTNPPVVETGMLVRVPVQAVYEAFIDPAITTKFWFTRSTARLEVGKRLRWEWEMYGAASTIEVKQLEPGKRILLDWGLDDTPSTVEWTFTPRGSDATFVSIRSWGFRGDGDAVVQQALGSVAGFTWVLAGLKAYLEHGIMLNLIADRFPDALIYNKNSD